jgi:hypothetical protein
MDTLEELAKETPEELTRRQLEAIKNRAIELWNSKWLPQIVKEYAKIIGGDDRTKFAQVQRYFTGENIPSTTNLNALLMAVNCRFKMICYSKEEREI